MPQKLPERNAVMLPHALHPLSLSTIPEGGSPMASTVGTAAGAGVTVGRRAGVGRVGKTDLIHYRFHLEGVVKL